MCRSLVVTWALVKLQLSSKTINAPNDNCSDNASGHRVGTLSSRSLKNVNTIRNPRPRLVVVSVFNLHHLQLVVG